MPLEIVVPGVQDSVRPASYSAFTSWLRCGKAYQLERIMRLEGVPAWYFAGGSVVHKVTEVYDQDLFEREGR